MNRISAFIKGILENSLALFLPGKDTVRRLPLTNQEKGLPQEPNHAGTPIMDFQAPEQ